MADQINDLILHMQEVLNVTSIAVTHDMVSAYKIADRISMLYQGQVIETDTPDRIQRSKIRMSASSSAERRTVR